MDTKKPGHHQTVIQSLPHTIGLPSARMLVLDVLRRKRNNADYLGDDVDEGSMRQCISDAAELLRDVIVWLAEHRPDLVWRLDGTKSAENARSVSSRYGGQGGDASCCGVSAAYLFHAGVQRLKGGGRPSRSMTRHPAMKSTFDLRRILAFVHYGGRST